MPKKITTSNPDHPANQLQKWLERQKSIYRTLSNRELENLCMEKGIALSGRFRRKDALTALVDRDRLLYKENWRTRTGWDFEEVYDSDKLTARAEEARERLKNAQSESAQT